MAAVFLDTLQEIGRLHDEGQAVVDGPEGFDGELHLVNRAFLQTPGPADTRLEAALQVGVVGAQRMEKVVAVDGVVAVMAEMPVVMFVTIVIVAITPVAVFVTVMIVTVTPIAVMFVMAVEGQELVERVVGMAITVIVLVTVVGMAVLLVVGVSVARVGGLCRGWAIGELFFQLADAGAELLVFFQQVFAVLSGRSAGEKENGGERQEAHGSPFPCPGVKLAALSFLIGVPIGAHQASRTLPAESTRLGMD
jgi:hypothetical protein